MKNTPKPLPALRLGDESLAFGLLSTDPQGNGPSQMTSFAHVRVGSGTVLPSLAGMTATPPPLPYALLAAQVARLRRAQS